MSKNIFITGTSTDVGKTYITALILKKLNEHNKNSAYYKVAMSGNSRSKDGAILPGDAIKVKERANLSQSLSSMSPFIYETAVSPHLASKIEGSPVDLPTANNKFKQLCLQYDYVAIEGSGGIICPLRYDNQIIMLSDFIKFHNLPCLIVADAGLGTINSVVLTAHFMQDLNINIKGIIFNNFKEKNILHEDNVYMCEKLTNLKVLDCIKTNEEDLHLSISALTQLFA